MVSLLHSTLQFIDAYINSSVKAYFAFISARSSGGNKRRSSIDLFFCEKSQLPFSFV